MEELPQERGQVDARPSQQEIEDARESIDGSRLKNREWTITKLSDIEGRRNIPVARTGPTKGTIKMKNTLAVYAGTFDPITVGHLWMIEQGAKLFDKLIVAIGVNPEKRRMFSLDDRLDMLQRSVQCFPGVEVRSFTNQFLITYARSAD